MIRSTADWCPLTLISFDRSRDAATVEGRENRSLNLLLRQQGVHSEIFRLALAPDTEQVELLAEVLAYRPRRPLVVLAREVDHQMAQRSAIFRLASFASQLFIIVFIATPVPSSWPAFRVATELLMIPSDDAEQIRYIAASLAKLVRRVAQA